MAVTLALFFIPPGTEAKKSLFSASLCGDARLSCVAIKKGDTWQSLWPDANERDAIQRINRMNIRLRPDMLIAVPSSDQKIKLDHYAPFPSRREDISEKTLFFDPTQLAWGAYDENGVLVRWGPASGGGDWCADISSVCHTLEGEFHILYRGGAKCRSGKYPLPRGGAKMPYCVFFASGYAFHGSPEVPGYNASHGCVRLFDEDARWINQEFAELPSPQTGTLGTKVVILPY